MSIRKVDLKNFSPSPVGYIHQYRFRYLLKYIVSEEKCADFVCIEKPFTSVYRNQEISLNFKKPEILPDTIKLLKTCTKRFTFLILTVIVPDENPDSKSGTGTKSPDERHANLLFLDNKNKTYERFEPYGFLEYQGDLGHSFIEADLKKHLGKLLPGYRLISFTKTNLYIGLQERLSEISKDKLKTGVCVPLSLYIMHLKILNPQLSLIDIQKSISKNDTSKIMDTLHRYVNYIHANTPIPARVKEFGKIFEGILKPEDIELIVLYEADIPNKSYYMGD